MLSHSRSDPGFVDLQKRIVRKLKSAKIEHQIFTEIAASFDAVLAEENVMASRAERKRLLAQVTKSVLAGMLEKLEPGPGKKD